MNKEIRVLLVEDSEIDAQLIQRQLKRADYESACTRIETAAQLSEELRKRPWDLIICDYKLPDFDAPQALVLVQKSGLDIPFIVVSGMMNPDMAVEMMKMGAHDYITKAELTRLVPAMERELLEAGRRRELREAEAERNRARMELSASEERYREIYETTSDIIAGIEIGPSGQLGLSHWNSTFSKLLGLPCPGEGSRPPQDLLPAGLAGDLEKMIQSCLRSGQPVTSDQDLTSRNGGRLHLSATLHPVKDPSGRTHRIILVGRDITERKHNEEALRLAHDELERRVRERTIELTTANNRLRELDRLKSEFLATMSHELRTPLNSIIGFTSLLKEGIAGPVNDEQKRQLGIVYGASKHLLGLINDLLDVSRIEAGDFSFDKNPFDYAGVMAEAIGQMKPQAIAKRLSIRPQLPAGAMPIIGDKRRILQVMLNLIHNAIKFTEKGTIDIIVTCAPQHITTEVCDTGIGMKREQIENAFQSFRQGDGSARRSHDGTGLGLYLCRKLLTLMGGEITIQSTHGQGTRVRFVIPRQPGIEQRNPAKSVESAQ